jgi:transposase
MPTREPSPREVTDDEWAFVAPYRTLVRENARRQGYTARRRVVKTGRPWPYLPNDLPPWAAVSRRAHVPPFAYFRSGRFGGVSRSNSGWSFSANATNSHRSLNRRS